MGIKVQCEVRRYEDDASSDRVPHVLVISHYVYNDRVRLIVDGREATVIARDLIDAVQNATRTGTK
jgi:hypothetical protein